MFCGKTVVVVFCEIIYIFACHRFAFFILVCDEKFHGDIKTLLLIIQFCLRILNSPRSKYFIKISFF